MPAVGSALSKAEDGLQFILDDTMLQVVGVRKTLTRAKFDKAIADEKLRVTNNGTGIYKSGEEFSILGELGYRTLVVGATAALTHARTVVIAPGFSKILSADANTVTAVSGVPTGAALSGNLKVDDATQTVYTSNGSTWSKTDRFGLKDGWLPVSGSTYTLSPTDRKLSFAANCLVTVPRDLPVTTEIACRVGAGVVVTSQGDGDVTSIQQLQGLATLTGPAGGSAIGGWLCSPLLGTFSFIGDNSGGVTTFGALTDAPTANALLATELTNRELTFDTVADFTECVIPASMKTVRVRGYWTVGKGAAQWQRVGSAPALGDGLVSADGGNWQIAEPSLLFSMLGARCDATSTTGGTNDTAIVNLTFALASQLSRPVFHGPYYIGVGSSFTIDRTARQFYYGPGVVGGFVAQTGFAADTPIMMVKDSPECQFVHPRFLTVATAMIRAIQLRNTGVGALNSTAAMSRCEFHNTRVVRKNNSTFGWSDAVVYDDTQYKKDNNDQHKFVGGQIEGFTSSAFSIRSCNALGQQISGFVVANPTGATNCSFLKTTSEITTSTYQASISGTTLTLNVAPATGLIFGGQAITGTGVTAGTTIGTLISGDGETVGSTWTVSASQTVANTLMTATSEQGGGTFKVNMIFANIAGGVGASIGGNGNCFFKIRGNILSDMNCVNFSAEDNAAFVDWQDLSPGTGRIAFKVESSSNRGGVGDLAGGFVDYIRIESATKTLILNGSGFGANQGRAGARITLVDSKSYLALSGDVLSAVKVAGNGNLSLVNCAQSPGMVYVDSTIDLSVVNHTGGMTWGTRLLQSGASTKGWSNVQQLRVVSPVDAPEVLGRKLRRAMRAAKTSNSITATPLLNVPAWAASTAVRTGYVRSNGTPSAWFICTTGGTTAASGGPTVTTHIQQQTDGTAKWAYYSHPLTYADSPDAPVVSTTTSSQTGNFPNYFNPSDFPSLYLLRGGYSTVYAANNLFWDIRTFQETPSTTISHGASVSVMVLSAKFAVFVPANSGPIHFKLDGRFVSYDAIEVAGSDTWVIFDFTTQGGGRKARELTWMGGKSFNIFGRLMLTAGDMAWAPKRPNSIRAVICADSLMAGSAMGPYGPGNSLGQQVCELLGIDDPWVFATGGTGFLATNVGAAYTYRQRMADIISRAPDFVVFRGSPNDFASSTAAVTAEVTLTLQTFRASSNAPIIVGGVWGVNNAVTTTAATYEAAVAAGVAAFVDPLNLTFFYPIVGAYPTPVPSASWNNSGHTATVTAPMLIESLTDQTHSTDGGIRSTAYWEAEQWRQILEGIN